MLGAEKANVKEGYLTQTQRSWQFMKKWKRDKEEWGIKMENPVQQMNESSPDGWEVYLKARETLT